MVQRVAGRRRLPRRSRDETRELMLAAAVDLLRERALSDGDHVVSAALAHVRVTDIAARATALVRQGLERSGTATGTPSAAAVTTGAVYQIWPRQADFQADLLFHVAELQGRLVPGAAEVVARFRTAREGGAALSDVVVATAEEVWRQYRDDPIFRVELSFLVAAVEPRVKAALAHRRRRFAEGAEQVWAGLLATYGRRMRAPYTVGDLTTAVAAQVTGSVALWWADPQILDDPFGAGASLTARVSALLVEQLTEPA